MAPDSNRWIHRTVRTLLRRVDELEKLCYVNKTSISLYDLLFDEKADCIHECRDMSDQAQHGGDQPCVSHALLTLCDHYNYPARGARLFAASSCLSMPELHGVSLPHSTMAWPKGSPKKFHGVPLCRYTDEEEHAPQAHEHVYGEAIHDCHEEDQDLWMNFERLVQESLANFPSSAASHYVCEESQMEDDHLDGADGFRAFLASLSCWPSLRCTDGGVRWISVRCPLDPARAAVDAPLRAVQLCMEYCDAYEDESNAYDDSELGDFIYDITANQLQLFHVRSCAEQLCLRGLTGVLDACSELKGEAAV